MPICGSTAAACSYTISDGILSITGNGKISYYSPNKAPWHDSSSLIKSAIINPGITEIPSWAFYNMSHFTSLSIPDTVKTIGVCAIAHCSKLESIYIPSSVTSFSDQVLYYCTSLHIAVFSNSFSEISHGTFDGCKELYSVTFLGDVQLISQYVFRDCTSLEVIEYYGTTIPTNSSETFLRCNLLKKVGVSLSYNGNSFCTFPIYKFIFLKPNMKKCVELSGKKQNKLYTIVSFIITFA